jgi:hypothetical protein
VSERATKEVGIVVERCPSCSAQIASPHAFRCSYCGVLFKRDPLPSTAETAASTTARAAILARIRQSRAFSECLVTKPSDSVFYARLAGRFVPLPIVLVFIAFVARRRAAPPWLATIAVAACVAIAAAAIARIVRFRAAPIQCRPAVVVDARQVVERRGRRTTTRHFATLAFETAACEEFEIPAAMAGALPTGHAGVAFERDGVLLHFRRVET